MKSISKATASIEYKTEGWNNEQIGSGDKVPLIRLKRVVESQTLFEIPDPCVILGVNDLLSMNFIGKTLADSISHAWYVFRSQEAMLLSL